MTARAFISRWVARLRRFKYPRRQRRCLYDNTCPRLSVTLPAESHYLTAGRPDLLTSLPVLDFQVRNPHNYLADFQAELELYERNGALVTFLVDRRASIVATGESNAPLPELIETLAVDMYEYGIVGEAVVALTMKWLQDLNDAGYSAAAYNAFNTHSRHNTELEEQRQAQHIVQDWA